MTSPSRRTLLARFTAFTGALLLGGKVTAATQTPAATEGPYYPTRSMRPADIDNDLVKVMGSVKEAGGEVITLKGQILDKQDQPIDGLRIEIWQCDVNGKYLHTGDSQNLKYDTGFQGFGHDISGPNGAYSFRTILPTTYPGRTPHIHVKVFDETRELLTTQFYLQNHEGNQRDRLYRRMSKQQQDSVSMQFVDGPDGLETTVNVVLS